MKSVSELLNAARKAQEQINGYSQEQIDEVCLSIGWEVYNDYNIDILARMAVEETGYGNYGSKIVKHKRKIGGVLHDIRNAKSVGCIERDPASGISKYAKPVGVVCAILPATNPTATCGGKALSVLKGRNAVIFKASSRARKCTEAAVGMMRRGLERVGAPLDLIQIMELPGREAAAELMAGCDLIVATGSGPLVKAAYSSGTPAFGVGAGNAVAIIAEDADIADAARKIHASKTFDNATSCSSENAVIVLDAVREAVLEAFRALRAHICTPDEAKKLKAHMWRPNKKGTLALNEDVIAKSAMVIAEGAGLAVPPDTTMILVESGDAPALDQFAEEKISPVLSMYRAKDFAEAAHTLRILTSRVGPGHSCGIHTFKRDYIEHLGETMPTSRVTVRQPMAAANGGHPCNRMPSTATLGCGTWGGNVTTENIHYKHFLNITWVNEPVEPWSFTDESMWGDFRKKYPDTL
ncbi:MAG: aldehyde dehydrogenase family protein [Desulfovibrio sp.]|jgi:sulfoacetaldehyde dehydrogenase|nr:aldehyde dehydrogenase family protein [Desulfovibrio sp.]